MTKQARIVANIATDVTLADPAELFTPTVAAQFAVVPDQVEEGWVVTKGVWAPPAAIDIPAAPSPVWVNKYGMMQLFTQAERAVYYQQQIAAGALTAEAFGPGATPQEQALAEFYDYLQQYAALPDPPGINLADPQTIAAFSLLFVALGILTADRAQRILSNQPPLAQA